METPLKKSIASIKTQHIQPDAKWKYQLKKYSLWGSFGLLTLCAALCAAVAYYLVDELDWDLYRYQRYSAVRYILSVAPWIWLLPLVGVLIVAYQSMRKTETGYRFRFGTIALVILGISFGLAGAMAVFGLNQRVNNTLLERYPAYKHSITTKEALWSQPEKGLLAGTIRSADENTLDIQDLSGKDWQMELSEDTVVRPSASLETGSTVKAIGTQTDEHIFAAKELRPWEGRGKKMGNGEQCHGNNHSQNGSCGKRGK